MSKSGFSLADLQQGAKSLQTVNVSESKGSKSSGHDEEAVKALGKLAQLRLYSASSPLWSNLLLILEDLYQKYDGDLDLM